MKWCAAVVLFLSMSAGAFAGGVTVVATVHAENYDDYADSSIAVLVSSIGGDVMWLNTNYSLPLLFPERDRLLGMLQDAANKIDIAFANQTTIQYMKEIGDLYTDNGALLSVWFTTAGYAQSFVVIQIRYDGNNDGLLLNKADVGQLIAALQNAKGAHDDYARQVALFQ